MTGISISVVVPTFNRKDMLSRALLSIFSQSLEPFEVIVVDNGSNDNTQEMLRNEFPQVRLLLEPEKGVSRARNKGIYEANGEWIAFLDSDDEWQPDKLKVQTREILGSENIISHTDELWYRNGVRVNPKNIHKKSGGYIFDRCLELCCISPSSVMVKKTLFDDIGYFDENLPACEDYDMWLRVCSKYPILFVDKPLTIKHGGHGDQLSKKYWGMDRFRVEAIEKIINSEKLTGTQKEAAKHKLQEKLKILIDGGQKRLNEETVSIYSKKLDELSYLNKL